MDPGEARRQGPRAPRRGGRHPRGGPRRAGRPAAGGPRPRPRLRAARRAAEPRVHARRGADPDPRDRRDHRRLHGRRQLPLPPAAVRARRPPRGHPRREPRAGLDGGRQRLDIARQLPRLARAGPVIRPHDRVAQLVLLGGGAGGRRHRPRAAPRRPHLAGVLHDARRAGGDRPHLPARGGDARPRPGRRPDRRAVAAPLRRRPGHRRGDAPRRRRAVHGRRGAAARLPLPADGLRDVDAVGRRRGVPGAGRPLGVGVGPPRPRRVARSRADRARTPSPAVSRSPTPTPTRAGARSSCRSIRNATTASCSSGPCSCCWARSRAYC